MSETYDARSFSERTTRTGQRASADNPMGDAPLDGPPYPLVASATHHDQVRPELLGQSHDLQIHLPHPEVRPC